MDFASDNWERVKQLFEEALDLESSQWPAFLANNCDDENLHQQVEKLLFDYKEAGSFLDEPVLSSKIAALEVHAKNAADVFPGQDPEPGDLSATATIAELEDPMVGRKFGPYRLAKRVGQGGMAAVYLAERADDEYHKQVAIKIIQPGLDSHELLNRFRKERQTLANLDHPNIVKLLDGGSTPEGLPFLVMDFVEGSPIDDYCDQRKLCVDERLAVFVKVCEAVQYAHQQGVIHRDLKPCNILVTADGAPKLMDFGIAKVLNPESSSPMSMSTQTGTRCMTPAYASPEQMRGKPVTPATDIYSLGVVLYELLSGHRPYRLTQHTPAEIERAVCELDPETPSTAVNRVEIDTTSDGVTITKTPELVSEVREGQPEKLRRRLRGDLDKIVLKALQKEPERRYRSAEEFSQDIGRHQQNMPVKARASTLIYRASKFARRYKIHVVEAFVVMVALLSVGLYYRSRNQTTRLTDKDTIVLADFANSTGDAVFDDALKTALRVALHQSPFLDVISEDKMRATLRLMTRPVSTKLTPDVVRELCLRVGSKAYIAGSIAGLGTQYVLELKAVNCQDGDILAQEQVTASTKERVLDALGEAASKLRRELGESLATVQKFDVPLELATTSSLEALKAYTLGNEAAREKGNALSLPYHQRAIQLDPNFATAYLLVGGTYFSLSEPGRASEYLTKAFQLRDHASELEQLSITGVYYEEVTGELEKAAQTYQEWIESYPRDYSARVQLGNVYTELGQYDKATEAYRESFRLNPDNIAPFDNLGNGLLALQRFDEARQIIQQMQARKLDDFIARDTLYALAFLGSDSPAMAEQQQWFAGKPGVENYGLSLASDTEAYAGHLGKARELTKRSVVSAIHADSKETGAIWQEIAAQREAAFGNAAEAKQAAGEALKVARTGQGVEVEAALAFAMAGDAARAESLAQDLNKRFPLGTQMQSLWVPTIHAQLALNRKNPSDALNDLQAAATPIELGQVPFGINPSCLYSIYIRGEAYLAAREGTKAAAEFQKIIDHAGMVWNCWTGALARLGEARANALQARTLQGADADSARVRALAAYKDFLTLWEDADSDIPILKQAKAEYAKLQQQ